MIMKNDMLNLPCGKVLFSAVLASAVMMATPDTVFAGTAGAQAVPQQAAGVVKGKVVDAKGEPLIGVGVVIAGQKGGSITDIDGNFSIKAPQGAQLKISYVGYKPQVITVSGETVNVTLQEDDKQLQELVVVGYGTQKKETLTGAVTVVGAQQLEDKGTMSSPLQAMQGTVPGVVITRSSGAPGDESWGMKLRGAVSTNAADPLVIVDGVEYSDGINGLRLLNSDDIESINFLKDASAAIYGSKAAGGVVLVTTKKGKAGKVTVEYDGSFTGKIIGLQPKLMNMDQWADAVITALTNDGSTNQQWLMYAQIAKAHKNSYIDLTKEDNPFAGTSYFKDVNDFVFFDTDWQKIMWGNSWSTQHELSISGGSEKNLFRVSLGYLFDNSTLKWGNNNNARYNFRISDELKVRDNVKLVTNIAYNRQDQVRPTQLGQVLSKSTPQPGLPASTIDGKPYAWGTWGAPNWYAEAGGDNKLKVSAINISEVLTWNITKDLDAVVNAGYNTSSATRNVQSLAIDWYNYAGTKTVMSRPTQEQSYYESSFARTDYYMLNGYLNYHHTFNDAHNFSAMLGSQYNYTQYEYSKLHVEDINPNLEVANGGGQRTVSGQKWHEAMMSYFGRLNYDYKGRYLLEGLARYDGSSKFQPANRWQFFWGVSGGWRISDEAFMQSLSSVISNLKLRASYGVVGNQSGIDRYDGQQLYNVGVANGAYIGSGKVTTINTNGYIPATDRTWERINNYNLGLDFGFLQNRLTGTVELFWKTNNNMLVSAQYPGVLGDGAPKRNTGKFKSNGWEGNLNWADRIGEVSYHFGGSFTYVNNKLVDLGATSIINAGFQGTVQGYPLNSYFGLEYAGKIQTQEQLDEYTKKYKEGNAIGWTGNLRLGDNMFKDINNDGKLTAQDYTFLGTDDPKISYSFNAGFEWKGFDVSVIFQGVADKKTFRDDATWRIPMNAVYMNTTNQSIGKIWSEDNRDAYYPTLTNQTWLNGYNYQISSWSIEDGAYVRLKNLTIGYTFPSKWLGKAISKLRVYFTGADLWEHTNIRDGWDPEQSRTVSDLGRYPFNRTLTGGINLTF